jgi:hypothetical protein
MVLTPYRDGDPKDRQAELACDETGEPWIGKRRQGENHYVESLAIEDALDCLPHVLVGRDAAPHGLACIDACNGVAHGRIMMCSVIVDNQRPFHVNEAGRRGNAGPHAAA